MTQIHLADVLANQCCQPSCDASSQDIVQTTVPLCLDHLREVYVAAGHALRALQQEQAGAIEPVEAAHNLCPACEHRGALRMQRLRVFCVWDDCGHTETAAQFRTRTRAELQPLIPPEAVVYYLAFGDRIKIGTSINLTERLKAIPHDELLATEPGSFAEERARHQQFAGDHITGEWFQRSPALLAHIEQMKSV